MIESKAAAAEEGPEADDEAEEEETEEGEEGEEAAGEEAEEEEEEETIDMPDRPQLDEFPGDEVFDHVPLEDSYFIHGENLRNKFNDIELEAFMKLLNVKPHKQW